MYYKKELNTVGGYITASGERYSLFCAQCIAGDKSLWTHFETPEACLHAWGLSRFPIQEE